MKALMFGWEFPPHILGGLGTASYGLTRGMSEQKDLEITFVIPKPWGDEDQSFLRIIGANSVPIVWKDVDYNYVKQRMEGSHPCSAPVKSRNSSVMPSQKMTARATRIFLSMKRFVLLCLQI